MGCLAGASWSPKGIIPASRGVWNTLRTYYAKVAQLVERPGAYPEGRWFESTLRHLFVPTQADPIAEAGVAPAGVRVVVARRAGFRLQGVLGCSSAAERPAVNRYVAGSNPASPPLPRVIGTRFPVAELACSSKTGRSHQ